MNIYEENLGNIVKYYPQLLIFLDRLGIKLGFGEKTAQEICRDYDISFKFFMELMQLIIKKYDFNIDYIDDFETKSTIKYLEMSHKSFLTESIPDIEIVIQNLKFEETHRETDCNLLLRYFEQYKAEVIEHLNYEDQYIYPYILNIEAALLSNKFHDVINDVMHNSISLYIKKHNSLDEKLNDLKNLIIKFFKPFESTKRVRMLLKLLYELEEDLKLHELIENKILFPRVQKMEYAILSFNQL